MNEGETTENQQTEVKELQNSGYGSPQLNLIDKSNHSNLNEQEKDMIVENNEDFQSVAINQEQEVQMEVNKDKQAEGYEGLSKNAMKKAKRAEMWTQIKLKKKEIKKEEKEKKKQEMLEQMSLVNAQDLSKEGEQNQIDKNVTTHEDDQKNLNNNSIKKDPYKSNEEMKAIYSAKCKEGQPIILDMQFLDKLEDKEFKSLVKQLCYMQSANKKAIQPARFIISSANDRLIKSLKANNADKWGIEMIPQHFLDLFPKDKIVYLSGDTEEDLDELDKEQAVEWQMVFQMKYFRTAYIIGGLVDHNRLKNVTLDYANEVGLKVKRFPIQKYLKLETSCILTCNHGNKY